MIFDSSGTRLQGNYLDIIYNNTTWTGDSRGMTSVASGDKRREKITIKWLQAIQDVIDDGGYVAMSIQTNNITLDDENSYLDMYAPKVEIGNKATDWTPAPEDIDTAISKTVKQVDVEYYLSNKSDSCEGGSWSTTAPTWVDGKFMWSRQKITYVDETIAIRNATCIAGAKGEKGESGIDAMDGYPSNPPLARWTFDNILKNKNNINYYPENNNKYNFESVVGSIVTNNGKAIFNGTQVVRAISDIDFNSDISISFWINISEASTQTILQNRNVVGYGFSIFLLNNKLRIDIGGIQNQFNEAFNINTNYHIIFTVNFTNKEINLYVNGIKKETKKPNISTSTNFTNYLWIGKSSADGINFNDNVLCGTLDDLRIYNYVLSQDNIEYLYRTKGQEAANGLIGTSIDSITEEFYLSTSRVTQTGGSWLTTPPSWESGKYIWTRSKIIYNNPSSIVYTEPLCSSEWEAVNDIDIGGKNLFRAVNSSNYDFGSKTRAIDIEYDSSTGLFKYVGESDGGKALNGKYFADIRGATELTVNSYVNKLTDGNFSTRPIICFYDEDGNIVTGSGTIGNRNQWTWNSYYNGWFTDWVLPQTIPIPNNAVSASFSLASSVVNSLQECWFSIVTGNKPTDWTPAPEDIDQNINDRATAVSNQITKDKGELEEKIGEAKGIAESKLDADQVAEAISTAITANNAELKIDSLRGAIQALTTQTDGKYQILEQDGEGWSFSFGSLIEDVVKTMGDANEALEKLDGTKDSNLKTRLSSWEEANSYIRIERRNNAPVIVLATNQDNFRVEISNSSIDFYEGNNRIAYVSNQAFYNTTGIVREEIRIMSDESGGFAWKTRQNGNLGLTWLAQISG